MATVASNYPTAPPVPTVCVTMADLHARLGGVPLSRIRLEPAPGTATWQDALDLSDRENRCFELVDGVLVEKAMGWYESLLAGLILTRMNNFLEGNDLGQAFGADAALRIFPQLTRIPNVCFISWDRLPAEGVTRRPAVPVISPDLAIEVLSESNTANEIERKLAEYFSSQVRTVWVIDAGSRKARVHESPARFEEFVADGVLDGGEILPGFRLPLRELFAGADRRRPGR